MKQQSLQPAIANISLPLLSIFAPAIFAAIWFWQTTGYGYVWDDFVIFQNQSTFANFNSIWIWVTEPFLEIYFRPLGLASLALDFNRCDGLATCGHISNVVLHCLNTMLVGLLMFLSARHLISSRRKAVAIASGISSFFYAFHPALIESVSWISARFDLLGTFFVLALLIADRACRNQLARAVLCGLLFFFAALCKEFVACLILVLPLWHRAHAAAGNSSFVGAIKCNHATYLALLCAGTAYLYLRGSVLEQMPNPNSAPLINSAYENALLVLKTLGRYLVLLIWPFNALGPTHVTPQPLLIDPEVMLGFVVAVATACLLFHQKGKQVALAMFLCFVMALAPVLNIFPLSLDDNFAADRYLTLPLVFAALGVGHGSATALNSYQTYFKYCGVLIALSWVTLSIPSQLSGVGAWKDEESLWTHAFKRSPDSKTATANLLVVFADQGQVKSGITFAEQLKGRQGGQLYADQQMTYAYLLSLDGQHQEALNYIEPAATALQKQDKYEAAGALKMWGVIALNAGHLQTATEHLSSASQIDGNNAEIFYMLGISKAAADDVVGAREAFSRAYALVDSEVAADWKIVEASNIRAARVKAMTPPN